MSHTYDFVYTAGVICQLHCYLLGVATRKKIVAAAVCASACLLLGTTACERPADHGAIREIVSVAPHHDTRAYVTVRYEDGTVATETWHQSAAVRCGDETFSVAARIRAKAYGPVDMACSPTRAEAPERR